MPADRWARQPTVRGELDRLDTRLALVHDRLTWLEAFLDEADRPAEALAARHVRDRLGDAIGILDRVRMRAA